jgi:hypothetical protein
MMTKRASNKLAKSRSRSEAISEQVEVAGSRPATFKLVKKAEDSYDLFRSGKRIGTARAEESGGFSARFAASDGEWEATAPTPLKLLRLVGGYLLTMEAREASASAEAAPQKAGKTAEEKLSISFLKKAKSRRLEALDERLAAMRKIIKTVRSTK